MKNTTTTTHLFGNFFKYPKQNNHYRIYTSFILLFMFSVLQISAQDITFNLKAYKGGYNISCNGNTNGSIDATIVGGVSPYTYSWSNGATSQDLFNVGAGVYTLTVTDAQNHVSSKSVTLYEPDALDIFFSPSTYLGGYNISKMGGNDGAIIAEVKGGAPPYSYLWNTNSKKATIDKLIAGTYSLTITDQNGCTFSKSITLIEPTPLAITSLTAVNHGGFNLSCADSKDGQINLTVSGGMPPYTYRWSNGSFEEDPANLSAGIYKVQVMDANKGMVEGQITLTQPNKLEVHTTVSYYANGYNISCSACFNGSITTLVNGGTAPYTYLWEGSGLGSGVTSANLTNLGPGGYFITATDANGCKTADKLSLSEPPASGWDKNGNTLTSSNFLGSTNSVPLVFKTTNTEKMRISESGNVGIGTNNPQSKLEVNGATDITGSLTARQGLKFDNTTGISLTSTDGLKTFVYGAAPGLTRGIPCAAAPYSGFGHMFGGWMQIFNPDAAGNIIPGTGLLNFQTWGGGSSIDASIAGNVGSGTLLLNYFCGNNTLINTGSLGGNVLMCSVLGNVGIGVANASEKLEMGGNIRLNSNTLFLKSDIYHGLKFTNSFAGTSGVLDGPVLFGFSTGALGTKDDIAEKIALFWNGEGKVGIGNTNPQAQLDVTGTIKISSLASAAGGLVQADNNGNLTVISSTTAGVGFWQTISGDDIFHNAGKVGIGTNAPSDLFQVGDGAARLVSGNAGGADLNFGTSYIGFNANRLTGGGWNFNSDFVHNGGAVMYSNIFGDMYFSTIPNSGASNQTKTDAEILAATKLFISADGNVGIGTIHPDGFKFSVNGTMRAKDITVKLTGWSDFVFDENYTRMSLLEKEVFYKKEKHLPNIGTEQLIVNEGLEVGTTMNGMMQNIEENTLDLVDLYKKFLILEKENAELKKRVSELENSPN